MTDTEGPRLLPFLCIMRTGAAPETYPSLLLCGHEHGVGASGRLELFGQALEGEDDREPWTAVDELVVTMASDCLSVCSCPFHRDSDSSRRENDRDWGVTIDGDRMRRRSHCGPPPLRGNRRRRRRWLMHIHRIIMIGMSLSQA